jgi:anti-anti-sigma regulatory factor
MMLGRSAGGAGMSESVKIESVASEGEALIVRCSGVFGVGSQGNPSGKLMAQATESWMAENPSQQVKEIVLDFAAVDYFMSDGVVAFLFPFIKMGVNRFRFLSSQGNHEALEGIVMLCRGMGFTVERK